MITVGIESTAHTFGVGILNNKKVLANERSVFRPKKGGIIPREARDFHCDNAAEVYQRALKKAKVRERQIGLVGFAQGPGLGPCLRVGAVAARTLSQKMKVPLVGVNHCIAHIEVGRETTKLNDPVTLYVSGGNTQIIALEAGKYRVFGETLDIAIGKCIDHFAREAGLRFPGGPEVERLAKKGKKLIDLPYTVKGMDFSFSGLLTASIREVGKHSLHDVCYSLQETAFAMLVEATERAIAHTGKGACMLTGGVAANRRLKGMLRSMCRQRGVRFKAVPQKFSGDNGAMIGLTAYLMHRAGWKQRLADTEVRQRFRTDEVDAFWR